jgi:6-phosphogluconolactonase
MFTSALSSPFYLDGYVLENNRMSEKYDLIQCGSTIELAKRAADRWLDQALPTRQCVALSGGRITRTFFDAVVNWAGVRKAGLEGIEFFWADERCVPPDHAESNHRLAKEHLLDPLGVPSNRIHRLAGELDPDQAAQQAEGELRRLAGAEHLGQPVLDLVFLGMGEDGHVASLFPDAPDAVSASQATYLPVIGPKPPPFRLTLSYAALGVAREVWVLISGSGKEQTLARSLSKGGQTPLARVIRSRRNTLIWSDLAFTLD